MTVGSLALGCGSDTAGPTPLSAAQAYWAIQVSAQAVNLALTPPYDNVQLTAVPVNALGAPLSSLGTVTYAAADSSVSVSPTGLVKANYQSQQTSVIVSLQAQGLTLADTVFIQVTPTPLSPGLATFSMQPAPGDSAKRSLDTQYFPWPVTATDSSQTTVCNGNGCPVLVFYSSSNPGTATIDRNSGLVTINDTGHVVFTATTLAYGHMWRDSVRYMIGYILYPDVFVVPTVSAKRAVLSFSPKTVVVGVGATVTWGNSQESDNGGNPPIWMTPPGLDSIDVVFDDSTTVQPGCGFRNCIAFPPDGGGNIPAFGDDTAKFNAAYNLQTQEAWMAVNLAHTQARSFPVAGTYTYHSRVFGTGGVIIVR